MMRHKAVRYLSIFLGAVFLWSALGKAYSLAAFTDTVREILVFNETTSRLLGGFLILSQLAGGVSLIAKYRTVQAASLLFVVTAVFLWILASALLHGKEIECHCFGMLNIGLPQRTEMALDLTLLNLLAAIIFFSPREKPEQRRAAVSFAVIGLFLVLQFLIFPPFFRGAKAAERIDLSRALKFVESSSIEFFNYRSGNRLLFLIDFPDFNCPPCFDDFMMVCDMVRTNLPAEDSDRVFVLFKPGDLANPSNPERLYRWMEVSSLKFRAAIGSDSLFREIEFVKTCVSVISPSGRTLFHEVFPMGGRNHERLLELLAESRGDTD